MRARNRQDDRGGREGECEAECECAGPILAHHRKRDRQRCADHQQFHRTQPEHQLAHLPQAVEAQLEPDGEQQQDDAELGKWLERLGIGYGYVIEHRVLEHQPPQAIGAYEDADQDEADDRCDAKAREHGDHEPGRAENDQRVRYRGTSEFSRCHGHIRNRAGSWCHGAIPV